MKTRTRFTVLLLAAALLFGAACTDGTESDATKKDEETSAQILADLQKAHPTPKFARSQLRQNLIDIVTAQADTVQTTSFFFNQGVENPIGQCPSIGFAIASTAQLTNPDQKAGSRDGGYFSLPQVEPTGIYTGDSTGTYVICVDANGEAYANYFEGFVYTVTGPAEWVDGQVKLVGPPSFDFDNGETAK